MFVLIKLIFLFAELNLFLRTLVNVYLGNSDLLTQAFLKLVIVFAIENC